MLQLSAFQLSFTRGSDRGSKQKHHVERSLETFIKSDGVAGIASARGADAMGLRSGRHELEVTMDPAPKRLAFLGQYSGFVKFLAKVLYCPRKTIFFCKSAVLSKKTTKKKQTIFSSLGVREVPGPQKIGFFLDSTALLQKKIGFLGTVQRFC